MLNKVAAINVGEALRLQNADGIIAAFFRDDHTFQLIVTKLPPMSKLELAEAVFHGEYDVLGIYEGTPRSASCRLANGTALRDSPSDAQAAHG